MKADELRDLLTISGRSQEWRGRQLKIRGNTVWRYAHGYSQIPDTRADQIRLLLATKCPHCGHVLPSHEVPR